MRLNLTLDDKVPSGPPLSPMFARRDGAYLYVAARGGVGFADRSAGFASACVTTHMMCARERLCREIVEPLALYLVTGPRRAALHAAGLVLSGGCLLLTGAPGAGKSTLAYACLRAGFGILAEDIVYADPSAGPMRAWGNPWQINLLPDAARFFPELNSHSTKRLANGESKLIVEVDSQAAFLDSECVAVLRLERAIGGPSRIVHDSPQAIRKELAAFSSMCPPDERAAIEDAAYRVSRLPSAHLKAGSDINAAVDQIHQWITDVVPDLR